MQNTATLPLFPNCAGLTPPVMDPAGAGIEAWVAEEPML